MINAKPGTCGDCELLDHCQCMSTGEPRRKDHEMCLAGLLIIDLRARLEKAEEELRTCGVGPARSAEVGDADSIQYAPKLPGASGQRF